MSWAPPPPPPPEATPPGPKTWAPGAPQPAKGKNRAGLVVIVAVAVVGVVAAIGSLNAKKSKGGGSGTTHTVTYYVDGTADSADLTMESPGGTKQESGRSLPYEQSFEFGAGDFFYVSAQNGGENGYVRCTIKVDEVPVASNDSAGAFAIASCKASG